ncbi:MULTISPECIES: hypothetical protein [Streptomyces]|uniref:Lipoprotein n=1 Tax=Streptomyces solicathayae TaxID=3081768 RepID=A0ABZ0LST4_9ACTN|nr:hypothetical protein [Streptomyces sp. HUAS YS2]WOX22502.1 hypothetical protein R2D22_14285 [Streptomyces sp. HUAS YS2]
MHARASRGARAALTALLLAATAACAGGPPRDTAKSPATGASPLERAALADGDLPDYQVSAVKTAGGASGQPTSDTARCQPLAGVMGDRPSPEALATVNRGLGSSRTPGLAVSASVSSYDPADARRLLDALRAAVADCGEGFTARVEGRSGRYSDVTAVPYGTGGDETVSWTTTGTTRGLRVPLHMVVVRKDAFVLRFMALDLGRDGPPAPRVPREIANRQLAKLTALRD